MSAWNRLAIAFAREGATEAAPRGNLFVYVDVHAIATRWLQGRGRPGDQVVCQRNVARYHYITGAGPIDNQVVGDIESR